MPPLALIQYWMPLELPADFNEEKQTNKQKPHQFLHHAIYSLAAFYTKFFGNLSMYFFCPTITTQQWP